MAGRARLSRVVAIEWDARTLRVVHAHLNKRGIKIDRILTAGIPSDLDIADPEQLGGHIRRVLDQEGITTRHALVDIPRDQAILKTLNLPTVNREELPGMVQIQIAKELPFPAGEAVIDFVVAPTLSPEETMTDVLVAAVRNEALQQCEATIAAAGLKLERVGLRPYANTVAVRELLKFAMPERVLLIDVRSTLTEIDVLRNSALAFSRAASVLIPRDISGKEVGADPGRLSLVREPGIAGAGEGSGELGEAGRRSSPVDTVINSLVVEVTRSIEAYRAGDAGARIDHVVIAGDLGVEEALSEVIQKRLNVTTELYNPAATFGWEPDEGAAAAAFSATLGLVLGQTDADAVHFDFRHPKKAISVTRERLKKAPIAAAVAILFVAAGIVSFVQYTYPDRAALALIEEQIAELESARSEKGKFLAFTEKIREFDEDQHVWVDVLYNAFSVLPSNEELVLTHLEMRQKESEIVLKTKALNRDIATAVIRRLEDFRRDGRDQPRFKVTMGPQTEKKREKYPYWQDFRITVLKDGKG